MAKDKIELDICPFCGSDAELIEIDEDQFCVRCNRCNSSTDYYFTELGAQAAWNVRIIDEKIKLINTVSSLFSIIALTISLICLFC